jgi:hypothetical protein
VIPTLRRLVSDLFLSADGRQLEAARGQGLGVEVLGEATAVGPSSIACGRKD